MNERHEQLMAQAWIEFAPDAKAVTKRFAELIVRECMSVADLPKNPSEQWDHLESSEVIAKHFGVEE
jgi:hypothetical protein